MKIVNKKMVLKIIKKHFNEIPEIIKYHSESNYVARLKFKKFSKIIKINPSCDNDKLEKEVYIFELIKKHGIPAPKIEFKNLKGGNLPQYLIMEYLGEGNLYEISNAHESKKLSMMMGQYLAKIHSITFKEQGLISGNSIVPRSFCNQSKEQFDVRLRNLSESGELSTSKISKCNDVYSDFVDSKEAVLCHMDYGPVQIIVNDKKITGIIDWEWAISSYSVNDFAKAEMILKLFGGDFDSFRDGYEKIKILPENYNEIKKPYLLVHILGMICFFKASNNEAVLKMCKDYLNELIS
jgi:fructosamine-3-kinase